MVMASGDDDGDDMMAVSTAGSTALMVAEENGNSACVTALQSVGVAGASTGSEKTATANNLNSGIIDNKNASCIVPLDDGTCADELAAFLAASIGLDDSVDDTLQLLRSEDVDLDALRSFEAADLVDMGVGRDASENIYRNLMALKGKS